MNELLVIEEKPKIPTNWNYEKSVKKVKQVVYKWKNITAELAKELWIAREMLSIPPEEAAKKHGTNVPRYSWDRYCVDVGTERRTVNRWIERFFPSNNSDEKLNALLSRKNEIL